MPEVLRNSDRRDDPNVVGERWIDDVERSSWSDDVVELGERPSGAFASMYLARRFVEAQCRLGDVGTAGPLVPWSRSRRLAFFIGTSHALGRNEPSQATYGASDFDAHQGEPHLGGARRIPATDVWSGFLKIVVGICGGTLMVAVAFAFAGAGIATWPVWIAILVMGVGLILTGLEFARDLRTRAHHRTFVIIEDDVEDASSRAFSLNTK